MQVEGVLAPPGTPAWDEFVALAAAGDMEIAAVVMVRDRDPVTTERVARRFGQGDPKPAAEPVSLADELRAMGLM